MVVSQVAATGTASFGQIAIVTGFVSAVYGGLALLLWRERTGHETVVGRFAGYVGRLDGVPRWAALTPYVHTVSLLAAAFGVWWDIAIHIDKGRDTGPFGTAAHYPIFFGILGIIVAGVLPIALAGKPLPARSIRLTRTWSIPCSAALVTFCGTFALVGFPLDDTWHRLFGEDVTLWGPTHLLMIGGAVFSIFARLLGLAELEQLVGPHWRRRAQELIAAGALLIAWDLFSTEFNYGVPQFPLILQPVLTTSRSARSSATSRCWSPRSRWSRAPRSCSATGTASVSAPSRARSSAPWVCWPSSGGAGSGCRCAGRPRCCRPPSASASSPGPAPAWSGRGWPPGWPRSPAMSPRRPRYDARISSARSASSP